MTITIIIGKRGGFCGIVGPRISINKDLEGIFQNYINQTTKKRRIYHTTQKAKYGDGYVKQKENQHSYDEDIFNLGEEESRTREEILKECVGDLFNQSQKYKDFQKKILYLDCE